MRSPSTWYCATMSSFAGELSLLANGPARPSPGSPSKLTGPSALPSAARTVASYSVTVRRARPEAPTHKRSPPQVGSGVTMGAGDV